MKKSEFFFSLPEELIAQTPVDRRDASRLMCLGREDGNIFHRHFYDLPEILRQGDCLVLNDSRVIPARLLGQRETGGAVELVLLRDRGAGLWECLSRPGKKVRTGTRLLFGDGLLTARVTQIIEGGTRLIQFYYDGIFLEILDRLGKMPLPPYIKAELEEKERYQTVYAKNPGSAAAPTAGLHFTEDLMENLKKRGVKLSYVTLHVGIGTFRPVKTEDVENHKMHAEFCIIPEETATLVNETKYSGGRVIAVGTTSCRVLESRSRQDGTLSPYSGWTNIFIYPGYNFKCIDGLLTNFHLPESTLIMLVSALAGRENVLKAYHSAVEKKYRFFSFGDAMFIS